MKPENKTTHFGFRTVDQEAKKNLVAEVFNSVASKYDLMNDVMSFGLHRLWKKMALNSAAVKKGDRVLDVAAGTGDLTKLLAKIVGANGNVVMTDINEAMLERGRERMLDHGVVGNVYYVQADAEQLPFKEHFFDCITIAFGLRNVTNKTKALQAMYHVLKPGGKLTILEFSHPQISALKNIYDFYSFKVIPKLGEVITNDRDSYQYLVESIRVHPDQESLKNMLLAAGFEDIDFINLNGGIVAIHTGFKY